jgi:hypothetical protein
MLAAGLCLAGTACRDGGAARPHGDTVLATIDHAVSAPASTPGPAALADGRPLTDVPAAPGRPAFSIVARTPRLTKAPCSSCHSVPIASMRWSGPGDIVRAHWSIRLAHAPPEVMTCGTCHAPDTPGTLRTLTGTAVAIDHAYQVCAQCHSGQAVDWAGGAHGKRVGGWAPPRVAFSCAECHDPHRPALEPRWPARGERRHSEVIQR